IIVLTYSRKTTLIVRAEFAADDLRMSALAARPPTGLVAVVGIDDDSIARLARWPWPRDVMAQLIKALNDYKVAVIGIDVLFTEPDDIDHDHKALAARLAGAGIKDSTIAEVLGPRNDTALADAIAGHDSTVLAYYFGSHYLGTKPTSTERTNFLTQVRDPRP